MSIIVNKEFPNWPLYLDTTQNTYFWTEKAICSFCNKEFCEHDVILIKEYW